MDARKTGWRMASVLLVGSSMLGSVAAVTAGEPRTQTAFLVKNFPTEPFGPDAALLHVEDALLTRYEDHLAIELSMLTPIPGTYVYPATVLPERYASPEVFTLWAFIFNHPESCVSAPEPPRCGPDDFSEAVRSGVYGLAGHVTAVDHSGGAFVLDRGTEGRMVLRGEIVVGDSPRSDLPPENPTYPLEDPSGAEVHAAVAPHGQLDPATISTELYAPAGNPACGCWWLAFFGPPEGS